MMDLVTRWLTDKGDYLVGPHGACVEDSTVRTRALVRIRAHRGEYWADPSLGSRLYTLRSRADAGQVLPMCREALQPLLDTGEILDLQLGPDGVYQDADGSLKFQLLLRVDEETIIALEAIPIGV